MHTVGKYNTWGWEMMRWGGEAEVCKTPARARAVRVWWFKACEPARRMGWLAVLTVAV